MEENQVWLTLSCFSILVLNCISAFMLLFPPVRSKFKNAQRVHSNFKIVAVCGAWVYNAEVEHKAHIDHIKHENDGVLPETPAYDYMNRRSKPFPWGVNSLFFNPHVSSGHAVNFLIPECILFAGQQRSVRRLDHLYWQVQQ